MKILYIGGESANFVIETCNALCEQGHDVTAVVQITDEYRKIKLHKRLKRINVEFNKFYSPIIMKNKLVIEFANNRPDLIFGSHAPVSPIVFELAKQYGIPWGMMLLDIPENLLKTERWRMKHWNYWFTLLTQADIMVFNNSIARDLFYHYTQNWFPDEYHIHYGTNLPESEKMSGIDIEDDYVLSICRLHSVKNCKLIPEALKYLKSDLKYVAIGRDLGELEIIKQKCKDYGIDFIYKGIVSEEEKWELIKNCAMYIYPQDTEYVAGQASLEAMWAGKPALAGNFKILKELYGKHAYYFNTKDPESLAKQIAYVRSLDKTRIIEQLEDACFHVEDTASYKIMGKKLSDLFRKVVNKK